MQLGFVSAVHHDFTLEEVLAFAAAEGFDCVEVMCWPPGGPDRKYGGVMHLDVSEFSNAQADDVRGLCELHGVAISALGYYSDPLSADREQAEAARAHLPKVMVAAQKLGLTTINTFAGADHRKSLDDNLRLFEQVWPDLIRQAEDYGVRVGIENCPMLFPHTWPFGLNLARSPAIWRRMFNAIPSRHFGLNYDPSHLVMQMIDPIAPIREFAERIFHTHAKDMRVDQDRLNDVGSLAPPMERSVAKVPGSGDVDWDRWIAELSEVGYDGPVCIEIEDEDYVNTLDGRKKSLRVSRDVLAPLIK